MVGLAVLKAMFGAHNARRLERVNAVAQRCRETVGPYCDEVARVELEVQESTEAGNHSDAAERQRVLDSMRLRADLLLAVEDVLAEVRP